MSSPTDSFLHHRIGILGCPPQPRVPWTAENVGRLKALGFDTLQLNIAWGYRPADEPLNLEDVVAIPPDRETEFAQPVPLRCDPPPARFEERRADLRRRIALCREAGMRSVFHFGAPFNAHMAYGDNPPNCLLDERTADRYAGLLRLFAAQFPGVDDLWLYTYDQDAWLCNEFGDCPRCAGIPLHQRVTAFVNGLAVEWRRLQPGGRTWWEPWELSAGQVYQSVRLLDARVVGLGLHSNVAEVMAAQPVDHWLRVVARLARTAGLPVIVEHVFGSATEELGAYTHIPCPQLLFRALRAITALPVDGIKEYYGLLPEGHDINLKLTGLFLHRPEIPEAEAMRELAAPCGAAAEKMTAFWQATSDAIELFPFATTWFMREFSQCDPIHGMGAAFLRGQQAHTPSWESSRRSIFMKTDDLQPDPWMLEDVQLQCKLSAERVAQALALGEELLDRVPAPWRADFAAGLSELRELRRRILSYACHLRETTLASLMRRHEKDGGAILDRLRQEMADVLTADRDNQGQPEPCSQALDLLRNDLPRFLETYFKVPEPTPVPPAVGEGPWDHKGPFTATSR